MGLYNPLSVDIYLHNRPRRYQEGIHSTHREDEII